MIKLITPCKKYLTSYIEAYYEYKEQNITSYSFSDAASIDIFEKFDNFRNERNLGEGIIGSSYYWLVDDEKEYFIGEVNIRHRLTDALKRYGGHIGYGIRFSEQNKGYGTMMLSLALDKAKEIGIKTVLITCNDKNIASAKVMENNGLKLQDKIPNFVKGKHITTRRYVKEL